MSSLVLSIVDLLLEDVAEKPERLVRAQEIARRDILPLVENDEKFLRKVMDAVRRDGSVLDNNQILAQVRREMNH